MQISRIAVFLICLAVRAYRGVISPFLPARCRYLPTCSEYALQVLPAHKAGRGIKLVLLRLLRCQPWGGSGYDPPPAPLK